MRAPGEQEVGTDTKPDLDKLKNEEIQSQDMGLRPFYGFEGGPALPPKWTYPSQTTVSPFLLLITQGSRGIRADLPKVEALDDVPHGQITKRSLDFVKLTASERGDIPAELGVVNYRKQKRRTVATAI